MRILIDTNRLTDVLEGKPEITQVVEEAMEVWVPFVALAEIHAGFEGGATKRRSRNEGTLARFLALAGVGVLYPDRDTLPAFARLFQQLRKVGTPIPTNDLWIASLAVQHQLILVTRDRHFGWIPQVALLH
jgi:tRNA(fMet)-specific endonuclease VapC